MPVLPVGFADVSLHFLRTSDSEEMAITLGISIEDPAMHDLVASRVALAWQTGWAVKEWTGTINQTRVTARVAEEGGPPTLQEATGAGLGAGTGALAPQNCAILVRKVTDLGGRRGRGRMYLPWVKEADVNDVGQLVTGSITVYQGYMTTFFTELVGDGLLPVILHSEGESALIPPTRLTAFVVDNMIATQRQRLRR